MNSNVFKKIGNALLGLLTFIAIVGGTLGLTITLINPVNLWWAIAPIETPFGVIKYSSVLTYLEYVQTYYYFSIGRSGSRLFLGLTFGEG